MARLTEADLKAFQQAVYKDYGVMLPDEVLYKESFNFLKFVAALIKFDAEDKEKRKEVLKASLPLS